MARREFVQKILVRLTPEDAGLLREVQRDHPGLDAASTFRAILRLALLPRDVWIHYRWPPGHQHHDIIPEWRSYGPFNPPEAAARMELLHLKEMEVRLVQVEAKAPRPVWPADEDDTEEE